MNEHFSDTYRSSESVFQTVSFGLHCVIINEKWWCFWENANSIAKWCWCIVLKKVSIFVWQPIHSQPLHLSFSFHHFHANFFFRHLKCIKGTYRSTHSNHTLNTFYIWFLCFLCYLIVFFSPHTYEFFSSFWIDRNIEKYRKSFTYTKVTFTTRTTTTTTTISYTFFIFFSSIAFHCKFSLSTKYIHSLSTFHSLSSLFSPLVTMFLFNFFQNLVSLEQMIHSYSTKHTNIHAHSLNKIHMKIKFWFSSS